MRNKSPLSLMQTCELWLELFTWFISQYPTWGTFWIPNGSNWTCKAQ